MKNTSSSPKKRLPSKGERLGWKSMYEKESINTREILDKDLKMQKPERPSYSASANGRFLIP